MRALVFGGIHHLGAHVVAELRARGHQASVIDFEDPEQPDQPESSPRVPIQRIGAGDLPEPVFDPAEFDVLVFCGMDTSLGLQGPDVSEAELDRERSMLDRLLTRSPRALVLTSSAAVYSLGSGPERLDETARTGPDSPLGIHALRLEEAARAFAEASGAPLVVLRTGLVSGSRPGIRYVGRVPKAGALLPGLVTESIAYPRVTLRVDETRETGGTRLADFVHVTDVAAAHVLAAEKALAAPDLSATLNIGTGTTIPLDEIRIESDSFQLVDMVGTVPVRDASASGVTLSSTAALELLGWEAYAPATSVVRSEIAHFADRALGTLKIGLDVRIGNEFIASRMSGTHMSVFGLLVAEDAHRVFDPAGMRFRINDSWYEADAFPRRGLPVSKSMRVYGYRLRIPLEDVRTFSIQNPMKIVFVGPDGRWLERRLTYSLLRSTPDHRRSRLFSLHGGESTLFVRQSDTNRMYFTLRARNHTDRLSQRLLIRLAKLAAAIRKRSTVLVYEKESARYEESGSVLFEEMVDRGIPDVHYILAPEALENVPARYRHRVLRRFSFRHYYHFFCARTFIGTETVFSAAELRSADRNLMKRISRHDYRFVFLQHGVMYMVALSSRQRRFFRAGIVFPEGTKIVCSSQKEAGHFVSLGGFPPDDMYVSGLPKFDRAVLDAGADRILIMPTWRPWEHNIIRTQPAESLYYQMLLEMFAAVPDELKHKTYVLPHPLVREALASTELSRHMWEGPSYDEALRGAVMLITDYSSISYDAFYRGANVVFWWKEKDFCMGQYGGHLMLEEHTAFGPVCYDSASLTDAIDSLYGRPQDPEYVTRYREIVEFHDGRNTERLIEMMKADGLV